MLQYYSQIRSYYKPLYFLILLRDNALTYISLPTILAMPFSSPISLAKRSGLKDCAPSQSAASGLLWTSIKSPSAPTATAAFAKGSTIHHRPAAWLGSTTTGRWLSFFTAGIALTSSVLLSLIHISEPTRRH